MDVVQTLCDLIRIPSVNPMGHPDTDSIYYEAALTDWLEQTFTQLGLAWHRQPVAPRRDNILARLDGSVAPEDGGRLVVLEVHQDTVPVGGMTIDPWNPVVQGGRVAGRGACDVKGGMAALLVALARLAHDRPPNRPTVVLACSVNEEYGFTGAYQLAESWARNTCPLVVRRPDAVIVAEPTSLDVVVAHKGVLRWRCTATGRAAHSSCPERGQNAIYQMARSLPALEAYADALRQQTAHPRLGTPTLSVGTIQGGISVNTVPDRCTIEIDRRLLPDEQPHQAWITALQWLAEYAPETATLTHHEPYLAAAGLDDRINQPLAQQLAQLARRHGFDGRLTGVPYGTDAHAFAQLEIPTVVFGPGSIDQAHTDSEWIAIDQLHAAADIYYEYMRTGPQQ